MRQILLDTNFMLACVKNKIDFFRELGLGGFKVLVPEEVLIEVKKVADSKQKAHSKEAAELALRILGKNKSKFKKIRLNKKPVDKGIIDFAEKNKNIVIATLDRELKKKIKNPKLVIRERKRLEII